MAEGEKKRRVPRKRPAAQLSLVPEETSYSERDIPETYPTPEAPPFEVAVEKLQQQFMEVSGLTSPTTVNINGAPLGRSMDASLDTAFKTLGWPYMGGSSGKGWSRQKIIQDCLHLHHELERRALAGEDRVAGEALEVGSCMHAFLAARYWPDGSMDPQQLYDALLAIPDAPLKHVQEAWRVYTAYDLFYEGKSTMTPVAVEMWVKDKKGDTCRYDTLVEVSGELDGKHIPSGLYGLEHKTLGRFGEAETRGWFNDGSILSQMMCWRDAVAYQIPGEDIVELSTPGLENAFGPLKGIIMNLCGKQKDPKFERIVIPMRWDLVEAHKRDLAAWDGLVALADGLKVWPRSRSHCIGRYGGLCQLFDECAGETSVQVRFAADE